MEATTEVSQPEGLAGIDAATEAVGQYVTFFVEKEFFAFPLRSVLEIIRVPDTVKVPLAPTSLVGLTNLRGSVLPVLDLRRILALPDVEHTDATRVVVTDVGTPVGLVVDRVAQVLNVDQNKIESSEGIQSTVRADLLTGVVKDVGNRSLVQLLDVEHCVNLEFSAMVAGTEARTRRAAGQQVAESVEAERDDFFQIVSFVVDGQEYAFPIADIEEIVRVPEQVSRVPRADANVIGIMNLRDRLLPLVSMRRIFGLPEAGESDTERILVVALASEGRKRQSVGIVVDQVREVLRVERSARESMPPLLNRGREEQIESICRLEEGRRLVSVLSSKTMFQHQVVEAALGATREDEKGEAVDEGKRSSEEANEEEEKRLVVFNLAQQEYGVMVEMIQEIIRVPEEMSRVPKTQEHIEGMVNLRGSVLPVLDMRARFGIPRLERNDRQRILVLNQAGVCTGFIVDSVSEVLRLSHGVIESAPHLSDEQTRIMGTVANLKERKRMIQILEAAELVAASDAGGGESKSPGPGKPGKGGNGRASAPKAKRPG